MNGEPCLKSDTEGVISKSKGHPELLKCGPIYKALASGAIMNAIAIVINGVSHHQDGYTQPVRLSFVFWETFIFRNYSVYKQALLIIS